MFNKLNGRYVALVEEVGKKRTKVTKAYYDVFVKSKDNDIQFGYNLNFQTDFLKNGH